MRQSNLIQHPQSTILLLSNLAGNIDPLSQSQRQDEGAPPATRHWQVHTSRVLGTRCPAIPYRKTRRSWRLLVGQSHSSHLFQGRKRSRFHSRHYHSIPLDARLCIDFWLATGPPSERKVAVDYPFLPDDVLWDYSKLRFYAFSTFLAGVVLAGLIGIGGGMVLGPLMLVQWASILESRPTLPPP
jgi:hypothetical protein